MAHHEYALGLVLGVLSAVCNGSFVVLTKLDAVRSLDLHPLVFMTYASTGVFLSSWLVVPFLGKGGARLRRPWL